MKRTLFVNDKLTTNELLKHALLKVTLIILFFAGFLPHSNAQSQATLQYEKLGRTDKLKEKSAEEESQGDTSGDLIFKSSQPSNCVKGASSVESARSLLVRASDRKVKAKKVRVLQPNHFFRFNGWV